MLHGLRKTRDEAIAAGHRRYFPGVACRKEHVSPHYVHGSPRCMICRAAVEILLPADMPSTREEALNYGLNTYFTGEPCKHGHVAPREARTRGCTKCSGERFREPGRLRRMTTDARVHIHPDDIEELDAIAQALMWARFPQSSPYLARLGPKPTKRRNGIYAFRCHSKDVDTLRAFATALAAQRSNQP